MPFKAKDPPTAANAKHKRDGLHPPETTPGAPEPVDLNWTQEQREQGMIPIPPPPEAQKILKPRKGRSDKGDARSDKLDREVSEEDYLNVYDAYRHTGSPAAIAEQTGLKVKHVEHLIDKGVVRLGLPSIKDHATDLAEVNRRLVKHGGLPPTKATEDNFALNLPEAQQGVTDRVARETAAAQTMLSAAMKISSVYGNYLEKIMEVIANPDGGFALPEQVGPELIAKLAVTADKLSGALDRAVRLSRLTAGEPEQNLSLQVAMLIGTLNTQELHQFDKTGQIPPKLRGRLNPGSVIDADATPSKVPGDEGP